MVHGLSPTVAIVDVPGPSTADESKTRIASLDDDVSSINCMCGSPYLIAFKILKFYKIFRYIEFLNAGMKY